MRTLITLLFVCSLTQVFSQAEAIRKEHYNLYKSVALSGYDPVSYFEGKPKEGNPEIKVTIKGVTYQFASVVTLNKFKATPDAYEPAYGGWCAYAMGDSGEKVKVDPETYKILNGRLYLFYNFWGNNTLTDWNENENKLKAAGDHNWSRIVQ